MSLLVFKLNNQLYCIFDPSSMQYKISSDIPAKGSLYQNFYVQKKEILWYSQTEENKSKSANSLILAVGDEARTGAWVLNYKTNKLDYIDSKVINANAKNILNVDSKGSKFAADKDFPIVSNFIKEHKELNKLAKKAQKAYYDTGNSIMSDREYDALFDKIKAIEDKYNYRPKDSITQTAGILQKNSKLEKVKHIFPALSLDKVKNDPAAMKAFLGNQEGILSRKCDGLTLVATYNKGQLDLLATRGNGSVGENVTFNGQVLNCIPKNIPDKGNVVIRGEYLISYSDFNKINNALPNGESYSNPRNLASGTINCLDPNIVRARQGDFYVFELVACTGFDKLDTYEKQLNYCKKLGFTPVESHKVNASNIEQKIQEMTNNVKNLGYPTDGLVLKYNDIKYGESLGYTNHAPRHSLAYKFSDDLYETELVDIIWQAGKTGKITPVAILKPVEIEGSIIQRATLNNNSYMQDKLGTPYKGQKVWIYKSNMVIPQIDHSIKQNNPNGIINIPTTCPSCGNKLKQNKNGSVITLVCDNNDCPAKQLNKFLQFASKAAMNFEGLSTRTIEDLVDAGLLSTLSDFYKLPDHKAELLQLEGFGEKSYNNLVKVLNNSKGISLERLMFGLCIPRFGMQTVKDYLEYEKGKIRVNYTEEDWQFLANAIGKVNAAEYKKWCSNKANINELVNLINIIKPVSITIKTNSTNNNGKLAGKSFCITGSLVKLRNRDEFISLVESNGGQYISSVKKGLTYLVTNNSNSTSSKMNNARKLGINIIDEEQFLSMLN